MDDRGSLDSISGSEPLPLRWPRGLRRGRQAAGLARLAALHRVSLSMSCRVKPSGLQRLAEGSRFLLGHNIGLVEKVAFDGGTGCHNRATTLIIRNPVDVER